jgi:hypothetical protein
METWRSYQLSLCMNILRTNHVSDSRDRLNRFIHRHNSRLKGANTVDFLLYLTIIMGMDTLTVKLYREAD